MSTVADLCRTLVAATATPPDGAPVDEVLRAAAELVARRQPLLEALATQLRMGNAIDHEARAALDELGRSNARWAHAIADARSTLVAQRRAAKGYR